jgi:hypothetical protein
MGREMRVRVRCAATARRGRRWGRAAAAARRGDLEGREELEHPPPVLDLLRRHPRHPHVDDGALPGRGRLSGRRGVGLVCVWGGGHLGAGPRDGHDHGRPGHVVAHHDLGDVGLGHGHPVHLDDDVAVVELAGVVGRAAHDQVVHHGPQEHDADLRGRTEGG